ncbi:MAG: hypothetical protein DF168_00111 [Candidatus Moanabacter tarae]|uniref:Uncharacterized protein n=1 Tax=Candidatus Moanibacter tarae TaxID=2200854 RepID=A0A2Z4AAT9_9BACT|nr:MAG: hypothetical protein DF168_00111 [Candidatus Moanabacter tarae]
MREMVAINVSVLKNKLAVMNISAVQYPTNIEGCMLLYEGRVVEFLRFITLEIVFLLDPLMCDGLDNPVGSDYLDPRIRSDKLSC